MTILKNLQSELAYMAEAGGDNQENPKVSVIIPVYERTDVLADSLDSVFEQTVDNLEIIVVADYRSADDIIELASTYDDDRLRVVVDKEGGVSNARNTGIEVSNGEFIAFLDSDDVWHPTKLKRQLELFRKEQDPNLALVYTGFLHHELDGEKWERHPEVSGNAYLAQLEYDRVHPPSTVMVTKECLDAVGKFDPNLPTREDYELWIRVTEQFCIGYVDEILVTKREQGDSLSKDFTKRIEGDLAVYEEVRHRVAELDLGFVRKNRILSAHHHVIGRDYESNEERWKAVQHLTQAVIRYPLRLKAWAILVITILGIDRNGPLMISVKKLLWS